jgi:O-antigen/teichoic acid export membrane protein
VIQGLAVAVNIAGNLILIPRYDIFGAAAMTVATELVIFASYRLVIRRQLPEFGFAAAAAKPLMASVAMAAVIVIGKLALGAWVGPNKAAWLGTVPFAVGAYFGALALLRFFTPEEKVFLSHVTSRFGLGGRKHE